MEHGIKQQANGKWQRIKAKGNTPKASPKENEETKKTNPGRSRTTTTAVNTMWLSGKHLNMKIKHHSVQEVSICLNAEGATDGLEYVCMQ